MSSAFETVPRPCLAVSELSGPPNANAKSQHFTYAISQIATLLPVVALNRSSKSQIAARYAAFGTQFPKLHWPLSFSAPTSQRFKSQRLQDANATKSQTLPRESFKVIFNLAGYYYFARLFLETLQKYPLKQAQT